LAETNRIDPFDLSFDRPIAINTGDGSIEPEEHADPVDTASLSIERNQ